MTQVLFKYLDKQIPISELEEFIYKTPEIENEIGEDNYQYLLEFNFNKKNADLEIHNLILREVVSKTDYINWKVNQLTNSLGLGNNVNIFDLVTENPTLLSGKKLSFNQFESNVIVQIIWTSEISQFIRHTSDFKKEPTFLHIGSYDNSYIHLLVNKDNEIWIGYDIINKEEYFAPNLSEAIKKLFLQEN